MADICDLSTPFIPLDSDEPLWEWYLPTDTLFFSRGAARQVKLGRMPQTMREYYELLPADAAHELASSREGAISGKTGSLAQCGYLYDGKWYRELMMVLTRDTSGRATRVMGRIEATDESGQFGFKNTLNVLADTGMWLYDVKNDKIWRDSICNSILGYSPLPAYPLQTAESIQGVHPSEKNTLQRHYQLFKNSPFLGDSVTDFIHVKNADGKYIQILTRSVALRRDESGKAELILGLMVPEELRLTSEGALSKGNRIYQTLNSMSMGQWNWDTQKDSIYFCPRYLEMLGYSADGENDFAQHWRDHIHPDDRDKVAMTHEKIMQSTGYGDTYELTYRMKCADGTWAWIFDQGYVTWRDESGKAGHIVGSITNITTAQVEREKLEELVRHDALTGLRSRAFCELELKHIEHNAIRPVSVISVDITGLKMINDYLGHARGDKMLIVAARLMQDALRRSDCVGRMGGDEFIIILPQCSQKKGQRVLKKLENIFGIYNSRHPSTPIFAAMGLACAETNDQSMASALANADERMYECKKNQRKEAHKTLKALIFKETGREVGADERMN